MSLAFGLTATEVRPVMVIVAVVLAEVPLSVAFTVSATVPKDLPAVNLDDWPDEEFSDPRVLFKVQRYVIPEDGHEPGEQTGVAAIPCVPPVGMDTDVAFKLTPVRTGRAVVVMFITAEASLLTPLRLAFTVKVTTPAFAPAVNVVVLSVIGLVEPRVLFRAQE
jgi:hypothetical protein